MYFKLIRENKVAGIIIIIIIIIICVCISIAVNFTLNYFINVIDFIFIYLKNIYILGAVWSQFPTEVLRGHALLLFFSFLFSRDHDLIVS